MMGDGPRDLRTRVRARAQPDELPAIAIETGSLLEESRGFVILNERC